MTLFLFVLNIVQVCLLHLIDSLYWILICPGIVFLVFTSWACVFVYFNRDIFYDKSSKTGKDRLYAMQHLGALFFLKKRSQRSYHYGGEEPNCEHLSK